MTPGNEGTGHSQKKKIPTRPGSVKSTGKFCTGEDVKP